MFRFFNNMFSQRLSKDIITNNQDENLRLIHAYIIEKNPSKSFRKLIIKKSKYSICLPGYLYNV